MPAGFGPEEGRVCRTSSVGVCITWWESRGEPLPGVKSGEVRWSRVSFLCACVKVSEERQEKLSH